MAYILFKNQRIDIQAGQTVLTALLDHGEAIPNSCRAGVCQSCLMQATEGEIPETAQAGLKDTLKAQGYFLACCCQPSTPLKIEPGSPRVLRSRADVIEHKLLGKDILRLRLKPEQAFDYRGGQYITTWKNDIQGRSYSLASVAEIDDHLECHIRRIPNGVVSTWLHDELTVGDTLQIQPAAGQCFYTPGSPEQTLVLAGTGTGLAPLFGIARDALSQGHSGEIHLIHGARTVDDLYMHQALLDMDEQNSQFHYSASVLDTVMEPKAPVSNIPIDEQLLNVSSDLTGSRYYLCGDVSIVNLLKKKLFLAGARMNHIYSDPFVPAANE